MLLLLLHPHRIARGDHVVVHVKTDKFESEPEGLAKSEALGPSIARVLDVLEDSHGRAHVALHYYWRWGQIHATSELIPQHSPVHKAQIFLQMDFCADGKHYVTGVHLGV